MNRLAFCIRAVELVYGGSRVAKAVVGDEGNALGASGSVVDKGQVRDGADLRE